MPPAGGSPGGGGGAGAPPGGLITGGGGTGGGFDFWTTSIVGTSVITSIVSSFGATELLNSSVLPFSWVTDYIL